MNKDLVIWMPPPIPYVILHTRLTFKDYVDAVKRVFVYDANVQSYHEGFDIVDHMAEVGIMIVSVIKNRRLIDQRLHELLDRSHVPDRDDDAQIYIKRMFGALVRLCATQCEATQLYDGAGELHYAFYNWIDGNLVLTYNNPVVATSP